jgi:hypothetical protein
LYSAGVHCSLALSLGWAALAAAAAADDETKRK